MKVKSQKKLLKFMCEKFAKRLIYICIYNNNNNNKKKSI